MLFRCGGWDSLSSRAVTILRPPLLAVRDLDGYNDGPLAKMGFFIYWMIGIELQ